MMGFVRQQERKLAMRFLTWHFEKKGLAVPEDAALRQEAQRVVDEAHRIAKARGRNVLSIIKELVADIRKG